jgi:PiT family inorganic phosphate transporter
MLVATWAAMPVSTTHAIVGAVLGMTVVGAGATCVKWGYPGLVAIVASWFVSPVFAGLLSGAILVAIKRFVLEARTFLIRSVQNTPSQSMMISVSPRCCHTQWLSHWLHTACKLPRVS